MDLAVLRRGNVMLVMMYTFYWLSVFYVAWSLFYTLRYYWTGVGVLDAHERIQAALAMMAWSIFFFIFTVVANGSKGWTLVGFVMISVVLFGGQLLLNKFEKDYENGLMLERWVREGYV